MFWDTTYILVILGAVLCAAASWNISQTYRRYSAFSIFTTFPVRVMLRPPKASLCARGRVASAPLSMTRDRTVLDPAGKQKPQPAAGWGSTIELHFSLAWLQTRSEEPPVGIEPTTGALRMRCSTV